MTPTSHHPFAAFVGIDWADAKHDGCLQAAGAAKRECFQLEHTPEAIDAWVTTLRTRFHGQPVAICLELNKGPLVFALRKYDFLVLFPINPLTCTRSGYESLTLAIPPSYGVPYRHGYAPLITTRPLGTDTTRSAGLYCRA